MCTVHAGFCCCTTRSCVGGSVCSDEYSIVCLACDCYHRVPRTCISGLHCMFGHSTVTSNSHPQLVFQALPEPSIYTDTNYLYYAPSKALVAGIASSLPLLVLRSMLKQRRILLQCSSEARSAEPCPMPSAAGKRVGRVLAGCSKPKARDKPGSAHTQNLLFEPSSSSLGH